MTTPTDLEPVFRAIREFDGQRPQYEFAELVEKLGVKRLADLNGSNFPSDIKNKVATTVRLMEIGDF